MSKSINDYKSELMQYYAAHRVLPVAARPIRPEKDEMSKSENLSKITESESKQTDNYRENQQESNNIESPRDASNISRPERSTPAQSSLPRPDTQIEDDTRRERTNESADMTYFPREGSKQNQEVTDYKPPKPLPKGRMGEGSLVIIVTHSKGLYPVENALVRVTKNDGEPIISERTDSSGKTPPLSLPAPSKIYSEAPGESSSDVLEGYNVRIDADGFVSVIIEGVPVFDGVKTLQPMDLVSISAAPGPGPTVIKFNNSYTL